MSAPQPKDEHLCKCVRGAMLNAINPKGAEANTALPIVYDATGAMLDAINP
jgi:hypothetical protein